MDPVAYCPDDIGPDEYEQQCEACGGYFEAAEETSLCPACEQDPVELPEHVPADAVVTPAAAPPARPATDR